MCQSDSILFLAAKQV